MAQKQEALRTALPPEVKPARAFIDAFVDRHEMRMAGLDEKIARLEAAIGKLTPRSFSLPPGTGHPQAKPERNSSPHRSQNWRPPSQPPKRQRRLLNHGATHCAR